MLKIYINNIDMAGKFTRKMYDDCALDQDIKINNDSLELLMDVTKYVHTKNICGRTSNFANSSLIDMESSLLGLDKLASNCNIAKYPHCSALGCMVTNNHEYNNPYACERGHTGDNAIITTNMKMPSKINNCQHLEDYNNSNSMKFHN